MRLATFLPPDATAPRAGIIDEDRVTAFADETVSVLDLLNDPSPARATASQPTRPSWPLTGVPLLAPVPTPRAIFGIGLNYADHIAETGGEPPERPIVFMKLPSS